MNQIDEAAEKRGTKTEAFIFDIKTKLDVFLKTFLKTTESPRRIIMKTKINKLLTPYNFSSGTAERIQYIVIHYVGATGGARANCSYYAGQYVGASAHYFVDFDGSVWQSVEDQNIAWHCGTKGRYYHPECRNSNSIGIELCVRNIGDRADTSRDWYFEDTTFTAAVDLTKELMANYKIDTDHVLRHYDVTHKLCPNPFVYNHTKHTWGIFKSALNPSSGKDSKETLVYPVKTGANGLTVIVNGTLNIRSTRPDGKIIGELKSGEHIFPSKKCFINGAPWYYLPDKNGWISAKYLDGGWVYETSISSPRKWWYIHKNYTCTTRGVEVIDGKPYAFDIEGYMYENESLDLLADASGELRF